MAVERKKETLEIWNVCECGRLLLSISEGTRGICSSCWFRSLPKDTKSALDRVIAAAFQKQLSTDDARDAIDDAMSKLSRDEESRKDPGP